MRGGGGGGNSLCDAIVAVEFPVGRFTFDDGGLDDGTGADFTGAADGALDAAKHFANYAGDVAVQGLWLQLSAMF